MNSNIRCIEIIEFSGVDMIPECWIVTLDVLKSFNITKLRKSKFSWIVTLDVLKFRILLGKERG